MDVWMWDVGEHAQGVTDSEQRALRDAGARLRAGESARVERALVILGYQYLTWGYARTGMGWEARHTDGRFTWTPLHPPLH